MQRVSAAAAIASCGYGTAQTPQRLAQPMDKEIERDSCEGSGFD